MVHVVIPCRVVVVLRLRHTGGRGRGRGRTTSNTSAEWYPYPPCMHACTLESPCRYDMLLLLKT